MTYFRESILVIMLYLQRRSTRLSPLSLISIILTLSACGSSQFPGRLPPAPEWSYTDLIKWDQRSLKTDGVIGLHGHGQSAQQILISKRRALADASAVQNVKGRLIKPWISHSSHGEVPRSLAWVILCTLTII